MKNFALLSLVTENESKARIAKESVSKNALSLSPIPRNSFEKSFTISEPVIEDGEKCFKHSLLLHSYLASTGKTLCDICISEILPKNPSTEILPLPTVKNNFYFLGFNSFESQNRESKNKSSR